MTATRVAMLLAAPAAVICWGAPKEPDPAAKPSIWELPGRLGEVEAFEPSRWPTPQNFYKTMGTPKVFRGMAALMPALRNWTDAAFATEGGAYREATLDNVELAKRETRAAGELKDVALDRFVRQYARNTMYGVSRVPRQLRDDIAMPPVLNCGGADKHLVELLMWFSSGDTKSVIHNDGEENLLCQIDGSKRLVLWDKAYKREIESAAYGWVVSNEKSATYGGFAGPPKIDVDAMDLGRYPGWANLTWVEASLQKGDCLYLPVGWYHHVYSPPGRNLAINLWWKRQDEFSIPSCSPPDGRQLQGNARLSAYTASQCYFERDFEDGQGRAKLFTPKKPDAPRGCIEPGTYQHFPSRDGEFVFRPAQEAGDDAAARKGSAVPDGLRWLHSIGEAVLRWCGAPADLFAPPEPAWQKSRGGPGGGANQTATPPADGGAPIELGLGGAAALALLVHVAVVRRLPRALTDAPRALLGPKQADAPTALGLAAVAAAITYLLHFGGAAALGLRTQPRGYAAIACAAAWAAAARAALRAPWRAAFHRLRAQRWPYLVAGAALGLAARPAVELSGAALARLAAPLVAAPVTTIGGAVGREEWYGERARSAYYAQHMFDLLGKAVRPPVLAALRGGNASEPRPLCQWHGRVNEKGERERARRVHAGWRDSYGVWRNADNSPCEVAGEASGGVTPVAPNATARAAEGTGGAVVAPRADDANASALKVDHDDPSQHPAVARALAADKGEQKGGGGGGGDRGGRGDPDKGRRGDDDEDGGWRVEDYQIIAGFKTMDTLFAMLRLDTCVTTWELTVRVHLALLVGLGPENIRLEEVVGVAVAAGDAHPELRPLLPGIIEPWAALARDARLRKEINTVKWELQTAEFWGPDGAAPRAALARRSRQRDPRPHVAALEHLEMTHLLEPSVMLRGEPWLGGKWGRADGGTPAALDRAFETRALWATHISMTHLGDVGLRQRLVALAHDMMRQMSRRRRFENNAFFNYQMGMQDRLRAHPDIRQLRSLAKHACLKHIGAQHRAAGGTAESAAALDAYARSLDIGLWAAALHPGRSHNKHVHEGAICSGVLYLDLPNGSSPIVFSDPRGSPRHYEDYPAEVPQEEATSFGPGDHSHWRLDEQPHAPFVGQAAFFPKEGDVVLFPSWLTHEVKATEARGATNQTAATRISYAFNLEAMSALTSWGLVTNPI